MAGPGLAPWRPEGSMMPAVSDAEVLAMAVMSAIAGAEAAERETLLAMPEIDAALVSARPGQALTGDKNYFGRDFEQAVADSDLALLRPVRKGETPRAGKELLKPLRQVI